MITAIIIVIGILFLSFIAVLLKESTTKTPGSPRQLEEGFVSINKIKMLTPEGQTIFDELKELFLSGDERKVFEYKDKIHMVSNPHDLDYIDALYTELLARIVPIGASKGLQLNPNETSYFSDKNCGVYTFQKLNKNIVFTGIRNDVNGFRTGAYTINSFDVEGFKLYLIGQIFLTNQRVVIIGKNKNIVVPISKILSYGLYEKNGIILNVENQNSIILDMLTNGTYEKNSLGLWFHDTKYCFIYALDKVMSEKQ